MREQVVRPKFEIGDRVIHTDELNEDGSPVLGYDPGTVVDVWWDEDQKIHMCELSWDSGEKDPEIVTQEENDLRLLSLVLMR